MSAQTDGARRKLTVEQNAVVQWRYAAASGTLTLNLLVPPEQKQTDFSKHPDKCKTGWKGLLEKNKNGFIEGGGAPAAGGALTVPYSECYRSRCGETHIESSVVSIVSSVVV